MWGPYVTSVQGIRANNNDRTYWKLLSNGQPLSQGKEEDKIQPCRVRRLERSRVSVRFRGECAKGMRVYSVSQSCLTLCGPMAVVCQAPLSVGPPRQEHVVEGVAISFSKGLGEPDPLFDDLMIKSLDPHLLLPFQEPGVMLSKMETIWRFVGANTNNSNLPQLGLSLLWYSSMWKLILHAPFHLYLNPHSTSITSTSLFECPIKDQQLHKKSTF